MSVQKSGRPKTLPEGDKYKFQSLWDLKKDAGAGVSARGMKYEVGEYFKSQRSRYRGQTASNKTEASRAIIGT